MQAIDTDILLINFSRITRLNEVFINASSLVLYTSENCYQLNTYQLVYLCDSGFLNYAAIDHYNDYVSHRLRGLSPHFYNTEIRVWGSMRRDLQNWADLKLEKPLLEFHYMFRHREPYIAQAVNYYFPLSFKAELLGRGLYTICRL